MAWAAEEEPGPPPPPAPPAPVVGSTAGINGLAHLPVAASTSPPAPDPTRSGGYLLSQQAQGVSRDSPYRDVPAAPRLAFSQGQPSTTSTGTSWASQALQRGPSNKDPLTGPPSRRRDEHSRPGSREPSPKTSPADRYPQRGESPHRGESPMRLPNRSARTGASKSAPPMSTSSFGLCMGTLRPGPSGNAANGAHRSGMTPFRTGGPVRAKADLLGDGGGPLRRNRPATASPAHPGRTASPVGRNSRPPSPQRPSSPSPARDGYPPAPGDRTKIRSLTSHMRRAPSPTPAFNKTASGKPRWRS